MKIHKETTLAKFDDERRIAEGVVYAPDEIDTQGDYASATTIEKAAHAFLEEGLTRAIDTNHDYQPNGSVVVESRIAKDSDPHYPTGAWVMAIKATEQVWQAIKSGDLRAFSIGGTGQRLKKSFKGREASELTDLKIKSVSLVKRGANRAEFAVLKSQPVMDLDTLTEAISKAVSGLVDRIDRLDQKGSTSVAKQAAEEDAVNVNRLLARRQALQDRLEAVWAGDAVVNRVGRQNELLMEIEKCDDELLALRGSDGIDYDSAAHSAFAFRGGQSHSLTYDLNGPDALGVRRSNGVRKAENEIDLSARGLMKI